MRVHPSTRAEADPALPIHRSGIGDILATGIGSTIAAVAVAYATHVPLVPRTVGLGIVAGILMLLCPVAGGFVMGRWGRRGVVGGLWTGLVAGAYALLMYSSVFHDKSVAAEVPSAALWMPGVIALHGVLGLIGAALGRMKPAKETLNWAALFALELCLLTLLLIGAGGLVTGNRAGLAVPDWPNSFGSNMVMLPLTRMTGDVFYEHAHRLIATLVGFTTLTMAIYLTFTGKRRSVRIFPWIIGIAVLIQAIMGGMRVTGAQEAFAGIKATMDLAPTPGVARSLYTPSMALAVAHGFFAHFVLAGFIGLAAVLTARWMRPTPAKPSPFASTDRVLTVAFVVMVYVQILLGVFLRQLDWFLIPHMTFAVLVALVALTVGMRAWGLNPDEPVLRRTGVAVMVVLFLQVCLGIAAVIFRPTVSNADPNAGQAVIPASQALITTAHQVNAALLLTTSVLLALWTWRLRRPEEMEGPTPGAGPRTETARPVDSAAEKTTAPVG